MTTLEDFLEDQCGIVSKSLLETFEPHREFVEMYLREYSKDPQEWDQFVTMLWAYLPEVEDHHFTP